MVYIKLWFNASCPIKAPSQDLQFLKNLVEYKVINKKIAESAFEKFSGHLWYLSEELAPLSFFDDAVPIDVKLKMVQSIKQRGSTIANRKRFSPINFNSISSKDMSDFITDYSSTFFERFQLSSTFLDSNIELWETSDSYQESRKVVENLKVVNDVAERGVALIEKFNKCLTRNEDQLQYLMQVVQRHRTSHPTCQKNTYSL